MTITENHNILYISGLIDPETFDKLFKQNGIRLNVSTQKFHWSLLSGIARGGTKVEAYCTIPIFSINNFFPCKRNQSIFNHSVIFHYIPRFEWKVFLRFYVSIYTLLFLIRWLKKKNNPYIIVDSLNLMSSLVVGIFLKFKKIPHLAIVTDIQVEMISAVTIRERIYKKVLLFNLNRFNRFVILNEGIASLLKLKDDSFIVVNGMIQATDDTSSVSKFDDNFVIHYSGGLSRKYGIDRLLAAFDKFTDSKIKLHIYGQGECSDLVTEYSKKNKNVTFFGFVPNSEVLLDQKSANLLINVRPSNFALARFCFPSKFFEYLSSGTPILTTYIPGMSADLENLVFLIADEDSNGIYNAISDVLKFSSDELEKKGIIAKSYAVETFSNLSQSRRVVSFLLSP